MVSSQQIASVNALNTILVEYYDEFFQPRNEIIRR